MQGISEEMRSRKEKRNKREKSVKGKDLEANIDGKENERNKKEIKEILKYIYSEDHKAYIWLRLVTDKISFCCFQI